MEDLHSCKRTATSLKKRLWHGCFPLNFAKFSLQNTFGQLILNGLISKIYEVFWKIQQINLSIFYCDYFIASLAGWFKSNWRDYVQEKIRPLFRAFHYWPNLNEF